MPRAKPLRILVWGLLAILGARALANVTGLVSPNEKHAVSGRSSRRAKEALACQSQHKPL